MSNSIINTPWNPEIISILDKIRINSYTLSEKHRKRFIQFSGQTKYFDVPIIVCSVFSSSFGSLGTVPIQKTQLITTAISMFIAIITSVKLYLNLASNITSEIGLSKEFYILSVNIFKVMNLNPTDRHLNPLEFLNSSYNQYIKLIESSSLLRNNIKHDNLIKIDVRRYIDDSSSSISSNDSNSNFNIIITDSDKI